jgi:hypothetical protein
VVLRVAVRTPIVSFGPLTLLIAIPLVIVLNAWEAHQRHLLRRRAVIRFQIRGSAEMDG